MMAIDPLQVQLISLKEAVKLFPTNGRGKYPHVSALYRYSTSGCRGVVLETIQAGSVRSTSREAVARFFQRLTEQARTPTTPVTSVDANKAAVEAGCVLDCTFFRSRQRNRRGDT